jgi:hypothetical protein
MTSPVAVASRIADAIRRHLARMPAAEALESEEAIFDLAEDIAESTALAELLDTPSDLAHAANERFVEMTRTARSCAKRAPSCCGGAIRTKKHDRHRPDVGTRPRCNDDGRRNRVAGERPRRLDRDRFSELAVGLSSLGSRGIPTAAWPNNQRQAPCG